MESVNLACDEVLCAKSLAVEMLYRDDIDHGRAFETLLGAWTQGCGDCSIAESARNILDAFATHRGRASFDLCDSDADADANADAGSELPDTLAFSDFYGTGEEDAPCCGRADAGWCDSAVFSATRG